MGARKAGPATKTVEPLFFATPALFARWLERHHQTHTELLVGFHKKGSGVPSITWPESVDQALCFGWIDGVRRNIDETRYSIRFTPRKKTSIWSAINIGRMAALEQLGLVTPAGRAAFEARSAGRSKVYSYEQNGQPQRLDEGYEAKLRADGKAWRYWEGKAPWYRRTATHWVMSAKREETRAKRLEALIECCREERAIKPLDWNGKKKPV